MLRYETQPAIYRKRKGQLDRVVQVVKRVKWTATKQAERRNWFAAMWMKLRKVA